MNRKFHFHLRFSFAYSVYLFVLFFSGLASKGVFSRILTKTNKSSCLTKKSIHDIDVSKQAFCHYCHFSNQFSYSRTNMSAIKSNLTENASVVAQNICKKYSNQQQPVLQKFCMHISNGTIYSLLGSSGCGKTTILSCIVGLAKWKTGNLFLFGNKVSQSGAHKENKFIGYMPQDVSLYGQLSTAENLNLFGTLYGMDRDNIKERSRFLKKLLDLSEFSKKVQKLSGGQKRRASLAVALIHSPRLLILDEPTVGLDPLLRERIWEYLNILVSTQQATVLITTHYIEEARNSNTIGVMRNGRLIAEDSPTNLLHLYSSNSLEQLVAQLCRKDEQKLIPVQQSSNVSVGHTSRGGQIDNMEYNIELSSTIDESSEYFGLFQRAKNISELFKMMTLTFIRHPVFLAMILFMPTIQSGLGMWTMGYHAKDINFGIINYEIGNITSNCSMLQLRNSNIKCSAENLSCMFLSKLSVGDTLILDSFENEQKALKEVELGNIWGYVIIPENFSKHWIDLAATGKFASNETLKGTRLKVRMDHSTLMTVQQVTKHLYTAFREFVAEHSKLCGVPYSEVRLPINYRPPIYGNYDDDYRDFILPGSLILSIFSLFAILSGLVLIADYKQGTFLRAKVAGVTMLDTILSHIAIQIPATFIQTAFLTGILHLAFGFRISGSTILYYCICMLTGVAATSLGLLVGVCTLDEIGIFMIGILVYHNALNFGATFYPMEDAHYYWQLFGKTMPTNLPTEALRSVLLRKLGLIHPRVWPGVVGPVIWTAILVIACLVVSKRLKI